MTPAEKIAKLETVLARVLERKDAPRPARSIPLTGTSPARSVPMATAARPATSAALAPTHASAQPTPSAATSPPATTAVPPPTADQRGSSVDAARVGTTVLAAQSDREEMPDLEFDDDGAQVSTDAEEWDGNEPEVSEFDIPAHHPGPSKVPPARKPASIELEAVSPGELEIDREPLAAVANRPVSQPAISPTPSASTQPETPPLAASSGAARQGIEALQARVAVPTPSNGVEEIEPEAEPIATVAQPSSAAGQPAERFVPAPLAPAELTRVVPMARPTPTTFRTLLQRSLALRIKG